MGSFYDKSFKPSQKVILDVFPTLEEAVQAEVSLHQFYEVDTNPHFANQSKQTSKKFVYSATGEFWVTDGETEVRLLPGVDVPKGFRPGRLLEEKIWITNGNVDIWVSKSNDIPEGFFLGRSQMSWCDGKIWVTNGIKNARVVEEEKLPEGWEVGFTKEKGLKIWINNGVSSKQHLKQEPIPEGWEKGRLMPWASDAGKKSSPNKNK